MRRPRRGARSVSATRAASTGLLRDPVRILGLDPGSAITGFAIIDCRGADAVYVASGSIRSSGESFPQRLRQIYASVNSVVHEYRPQEVAVERVFMHRNADSALKLGQARGAALCATFAGDPVVYEYAPREVKLAIVGIGSAEKVQVGLMVRQLLRLEGAIGADAADALAVALCHAYARRTGRLLAMSGALR